MDRICKNEIRLVEMKGELMIIKLVPCGSCEGCKPKPIEVVDLGEASKQKIEKIWDNVPIRVDPSPPSDLWDIFEFQTFLKNADPPLLTKLGHF